MDKKEFKKKFPALFKELEKGETNIQFGESLNSNEENKDMFQGHTPTAIDYLRRCNNKEQAEKTIEYLVKKGEIKESYGNELLKQLREKGLRSFGQKKEDDYYLRRSGISC
ncbi:MAG: DUF2095 family protein [Candidatus Bathyarchaeota archaeon]|nr:DUF2095 family protein [Candidatus Bathyarchaeota archaeon]